MMNKLTDGVKNIYHQGSCEIKQICAIKDNIILITKDGNLLHFDASKKHEEKEYPEIIWNINIEKMQILYYEIEDKNGAI